MPHPIILDLAPLGTLPLVTFLNTSSYRQTSKIGIIGVVSTSL